MLEKPTAKGIKYDAGKDRWNLLPWEALKGVVKVLTFGAAKHGDYNWQQLENAKERYEAASLRHRMALKEGQLYDADTGLHHQFHIACNELFLAWFAARDESSKQEK